ncbi:MAG TPA: hypothetical protein VMW75_22055 [Thermoanaerobaculia bacterium]|nr:hypothetical protein [Thermoanaerobaculia bacterium]
MPLGRQERALAGLGAEPGDDVVFGVERLTPLDPPPPEERRIGKIAAYVGLVEAGRMRARLRRIGRGRRAAAAREVAEGQWEELRQHGPARQRALVEARAELRCPWRDFFVRGVRRSGEGRGAGSFPPGWFTVRM